MGISLKDAILRYDCYQVKNELSVFNIDEKYNLADFYISLFFYFMELIDSIPEIHKINKEEYKKLARTLQKISILTDKGLCTGINTSDSLLYSACIYYILGYKTNSYIITKLIDNESICDTKGIFIKKYLQNNVLENKELLVVRDYFLDNNLDKLSDMIERFEKELENGNFDRTNSFIKCKIIKGLLVQLMNDNIWNVLNGSSIQDKKQWKMYLNKYIENKVRYDLSRFQKNVVENSFLSTQNSVINFLSNQEKRETINILLFNHLHTNIDNKVLYVVSEDYVIDEKFSDVFNELYIYCHSEEELYSNYRLFIIPIEIFSNMEFCDFNEFTLIIFDSFTQISNFNEGIKYEYAIGKVLNICTENTQIKMVDNNVLDFNYKESISLSDNEEYIDIDRLINCYVGVNGKEITVNIDCEKDKFVMNDVFLKKIKYIDENGKNQLLSYAPSNSNKSKSCKIALQLLQKGNKVSLFTPQLYHPTLGVYELACELLDILDGSGEGLINYKSELNYIIKLYEENFGINHLFSKLIRYGIVVFYSGAPAVVKDLLSYTLGKNGVRLVISNSSIYEVKEFSKFDAIVFHMLRINGEFKTKKNQIVRRDYWREMDSRDIRTILRRFLNDDTNKSKYIYIHNPSDIDIYKNAVNNIKVCKLKSGFEEMFSRIEIHKGLVENADSIFEGVDSTILDMLIKEVDVVGGSSRYFYSINENSYDGMLNIIKSRKSKLVNNYNKDQFIKIKKIGGNSFSTVVSKNKERLVTMGIKEFATEFIFDVIEEHKETDLRIADINNNKFVSFNLDFDNIKQIIQEWILGVDYNEIVLKFSHIKMTIEELMFLISYFVDGYICNVIPKLIAYLKNERILLSLPIERYEVTSSIFKYGCIKKMAIQLYQIGLRDRVAVNKLTEYLISIKIEFDSEHKLLIYLDENIKSIEEQFKDDYFIEYMREIINKNFR